MNTFWNRIRTVFEFLVFWLGGGMNTALDWLARAVFVACVLGGIASVVHTARVLNWPIYAWAAMLVLAGLSIWRKVTNGR